MNNLLKTMSLAVLILSIASCSTDSIENSTDNALVTNDSFAARFINESTASVDLVVYNFDGNVVKSTQSLKPGASFDISSLNSEETTFRVVTPSSDRIAVMDINDDKKYYVVLNDNNQISTIATAQL